MPSPSWRGRAGDGDGGEGLVAAPSGCVCSPSRPRNARATLNQEAQAWQDSPRSPGKGREEWCPRAPGQGPGVQGQGKEGRSPACQLSSPEGGSGSQSWSSGERKPSGCCPSAPWAPFGWEFWGSGRGVREGRGSCLPLWTRGGELWGSSLGEAGPLPNWSLILGFAIGVQQVPPTLIQRTYG